jgi:hypothetical protein
VSQQELCQIVSEAPHNQIMIIDTNIALHQIDALDHKCPATCLVVVLQTVLQVNNEYNIQHTTRHTAHSTAKQIGREVE